jgi:DNA polymerase elongation subunit (family B)
MCEERHYRFLKEPKGVVPTILQNLLDARKNTRKQIKENIKLIEDIDDNKKIRDIDDLNKVLDKRQLAYKISANSVASTTPIPCRINGLFIYKTIEEISKGDWKRINEEQEVSTPIDNLEVWSDLGFTKPKYVMRHPKTENLFRVNTHTGSVDCTGDHSLLRNTGEEVKPKDLKIGDKLMQKDFPLPLDTPKEPLFLSLSNDTINDYILSSIEEETAFVHGVFFAEGTCGTWGVLGKAKSSWIIYNQDFRLLERCKNILNKIENQNFKISNYYESARCYHLVPTLSVIKLVNKYRDMFYDNRKYKKFPDYIFNTPFKVRQAFFMGYYNGDGNRNLKVGIVINNKGNRGSASLFYLSKSLGYKVSISYSKDKDADFTYRLQCCTDFRIKQEDSIKRIEIIYQNEENYSETIVEKIIRNEELIEFKNKKSFYKNIIINCDRFPRQKLIDSLDDAILCANDKFCYVTEYFTDGKYIVCKKYCCNKEYKTKLQTLKNKSSNMHNLCMCGKEKFKFECKNQKNIYIEKEYIEYVYDIETENHHFAAGVGNMIVHNSMYGILGVKKGLLPFMPGAMVCTYMGRTNIEIVADTITKKYGGKLVYGDTDSAYITFPHLKNADESWDYALKVSKEVSALFPPPIYLEFEQSIYAQFFILTKKRYMYRACGRDGIIDKKIGKKGVLLARRDNALIIRLIYEKLISMIFDKVPRDDILYYILEELNRICSNSVYHKEYVITKSVGDINNMNISESYKDEKGKLKVKIGNYIVPQLPKNAKEKEKELLKKEAIDEIDYYKKCLPAVVQLAEKMRKRGQRVDVGTRLEYVIVDVGKNKKQYEKIENIDYFLQHNDILRIDFLDYVKLMINPIDDLLNVGFKKNIQDGYKFKKDFILDQYKFRSINRKKMLDEIKSLFTPKLVFIN